MRFTRVTNKDIGKKMQQEDKHADKKGKGRKCKAKAIHLKVGGIGISTPSFACPPPPHQLLQGRGGLHKSIQVIKAINN